MHEQFSRRAGVLIDQHGRATAQGIALPILAVLVARPHQGPARIDQVEIACSVLAGAPDFAAHVDDNAVEWWRAGGFALVLAALVLLLAADAIDGLLQRLDRTLADGGPDVDIADAAAVALDHPGALHGGIAKGLQRRNADDFGVHFLRRRLGGTSDFDADLFPDLVAEGADRMVGRRIDAEDLVADLEAGAIGRRALEDRVDKVTAVAVRREETNPGVAHSAAPEALRDELAHAA